MKITEILRYELELTEVLKRKMRQMKRKLGRGKKIKNRRSDLEEGEVLAKHRGKDGQKSKGEGGRERGYPGFIPLNFRTWPQFPNLNPHP